MNDATAPGGRIDRRTFLMMVGAVTAFQAISCTTSPDHVPRPRSVPGATDWFTADSFWNKPLPDDAPLDPRSPGFVAWLREHTDGFLLAGLGGNRWGVPCFVAREGDPARDVSFPERNPTLRPIVEGLRTPDRASSALTGTGDSPLVILDPGRGFQVALWQTSADGSGFHASTASIYWDDSNGLAPGDENPDGDPRNRGHRGVAPSTMLVQRLEIEQGSLDHVLKVAIPGTADWHVRPMVGHEPDRGGVIGEGMRLRIKTDVDLERYDLSGPALTIARALQRYGAIVGDNSGADRIVLKVEQDIGQWDGVDLEAESLAAIPVEDLAFVRAGWEPEG